VALIFLRSDKVQNSSITFVSMIIELAFTLIFISLLIYLWRFAEPKG